jgi:uncharacterized protein
MPETSAAEKLCLSCGLCCNGVIFADVQLQPSDDAARLRELGVLKRGKKFRQPCTAHDGCRCAIYQDRPQYCREFECVLLKQTQAGKITASEALRLIKRAKSQADRVRRLLEQLGDNSTLALSKRFQAMRRRLESEEADAGRAEVFGLLTVAVHELNVILSESFYR